MFTRSPVIPALAVFLAATSSVMPTFPAAAAGPAPAVQAPPAIRVVAATRRELVETLSVTGSVVAREEAVAGTDLSGLTVTRLDADQGDLVKKGDVLAVLDRSALDVQHAQIQASRAQAVASAAQVKAQIADAEIGVRQAGEALDRARALQDKGIAAKSQLDNAVNAYDSARAKLTTAEKALAAAEAQIAVVDAQERNVLLQIAKTEVTAPADGLVLARNATLGGIVSAAAGPLYRIAVGSEFELAATVAETALPSIAVGMPVRVAAAGASATVNGRVRLISPEINQMTRLGTLRIALDAGAAVRAGNFARGEIELVRREGIAVPASALVYRDGQAFLQIVEDGKVRSVAVKVGVRAGAVVEIVEGIAEGQEVVERAGTFVTDGDVVTPVRVDATGAVRP
ncbi:MAG TPA: efflux RND transporter periplasmic adaptor subunit [Rhizobiales bacterium]|nr:efflux RND transporter periplasmic adaptor subunit [Hyphomicrobiales bacterium]